MDVHFDTILAKNLINKTSVYETAAFVKQKMARIDDSSYLQENRILPGLMNMINLVIDSLGWSEAL